MEVSSNVLVVSSIHSAVVELECSGGLPSTNSTKIDFDLGDMLEIFLIDIHIYPSD